MKYIELIENHYGHDSIMSSNAYYVLGSFYYKRGLLKKPLKCFRHAYEMRKSILGEEHSATADCMLNILVVLVDMNKYDDCIILIKQTEKLYLKLYGNMNMKVGKLFYLAAVLYTNMDNNEMSLSYLNRAKHITEKLNSLVADKSQVSEMKKQENQIYEEYDKRAFTQYFDNFNDGLSMYDILKRTTNI